MWFCFHLWHVFWWQKLPNYKIAVFPRICPVATYTMRWNNPKENHLQNRGPSPFSSFSSVAANSVRPEGGTRDLNKHKVTARGKVFKKRKVPKTLFFVQGASGRKINNYKIKQTGEKLFERQDPDDAGANRILDIFKIKRKHNFF